MFLRLSLRTSLDCSFVLSGFPDGIYGLGLNGTRGAVARFLANAFNLQPNGP